MKSIISSIFILWICLMTTYAHGQTLKANWAIFYPSGAQVNLESDRSMCLDNTGNWYFTGQYSGPYDFNPNPNKGDTLYGNYEAFVTKFDGDTNLIWAKSFAGGTSGAGYGYAVTTDDFGNIYVSGLFAGIIDFDPGPGTFYLSSVLNYWGYSDDYFLCKLDSSGNFIWAKSFGSPSNEAGGTISSDHLGNVYFTGEFIDSIDFDPGTGTYKLGPNGYSDIFVIKISAGGNLLWANQLGGSNREGSFSIATDRLGNVYTTGYFRGTSDFDPGTGTFNLYAPTSGQNAFVSKLNSAGNFVWAISFGGVSTNNACRGNSIAIDDSFNVYTTGPFVGTADFDPGSNDYYLPTNTYYDEVYVSKLDSFGNFVWAKQLGSVQSSDIPFAITVDQSGNVYTTGTFTHVSADFDPGINSYHLTSGGFISKLDASGNFVFAEDYNGASIIVDSTDAIYINGNNAFGSNYIVKFRQCYPSYSSINLIACEKYISPSGKFTWTSDGTYQDTIVSSTGCDSIITIKLTISQSFSTINPIACTSYTSPSGKYTWTSDGTYKDTIPNYFGCDSIITIKLTISESFSVITPIVCKSYSSPSGKYIWTSSGLYKDTIPNSIGCDSIITVYLTINRAASVIYPTTCKPYISPSRKHIWTSSGTYKDTLVTAKGCDSLITVHLTIGTPSSSIYPTACEEYLSPSGKYNWKNSGTYTDTLMAIGGCDSVVTVNLTINTVDDSVTRTPNHTLTATASGATFQWLDCNNNHSAISGETSNSITLEQGDSFAVEVTQNGCVDTSDCYGYEGPGGLSDHNQLSGVRIYPNPTTGIVHIKLDESLNPRETYHLQLTDIAGRTVLEKDFSGTTYRMDAGNLNSGTYLVRILCSEGVHYERIVVQN